jgi:phage terminase large subunit GpA-like protein
VATKTRPRPQIKAVSKTEASPLVRIDARKTMLQRWSVAFRPRPRLSSEEWITTNVVIPPEIGANPGRYGLVGREYLRGPLAAIDDPEVHEIVLLWPTQVGKTTFLQALLQSRCDIFPAPIMLAGPDQDEILKLRDDCYRMCAASARLRDCIPPERLRNDRWIDFAGVRCYLAWAGNTQRLAGKSVQMVLATEIDKWAQATHEGSTQALVRNRVKAWHRSLILWESTPTDEASPIWRLHETSNRCQYYCPCPHCDHYQVLRFHTLKEGPLAGRGGIGGIQRPDGSYVTSDEAIKEAHYVCEKGCRIDNEHKATMVARGVWAPEGVTVKSLRKEPRKRGRWKPKAPGRATRSKTPVCEGPEYELVGKPVRSGRITGFHMTSLVSDTISFGRMAAAWLDARAEEKLLQDFVNNWLGERWLVRAKIPKWDVLFRKVRGGHSRGTAPAPTFFMTAGCDVQRDRCYYVIRAWGEGGSSWLVDWGCCQQRIGVDGTLLYNSDLAQLDELVLNRIIPLTSINAAGWPTLMVRLMGIDCGFETDRVWKYVRKRDQERVRAVAGDSQMGATFYQMTTVEKSARDGKSYEGGLKRWGINTGTYKTDIQHRWAQPPHEPGSWLITGDTLEIVEAYLRQVANEGPIWTTNKHGRQIMNWTVLEKSLGNHYWDCEVYARALADMVTGGDWDHLLSRCPTNTVNSRITGPAGEDFSARD